MSRINRNEQVMVVELNDQHDRPSTRMKMIDSMASHSAKNTPRNNRSEKSNQGINSKLDEETPRIFPNDLMMNDVVLEDEVLKKLNMEDIRRIFDEADTDGGGDLSESEFVSLFGHLLHEANERTVRAMFRKIDSNANGAVTFDEFSSYILFQENAHRAGEGADGRIYATHPLKDRNKMKNLHNDHINCIVSDPERNIYYTSSKDNSVRAWNSVDLSHVSTFHFSPPRSYIHDLSFDRVERELYVAGLERILYVYNERFHLVRVFQGKAIQKDEFKPEKFVYTIPSHMRADYFKIERTENEKQDEVRSFISKVKFDRLNSENYLTKTDIVLNPIILTDFLDSPTSLGHLHMNFKNFMCVGHDGGYVRMYDISDASTTNIINVHQSWKPHSDWVTKVLPSETLGCIISSSLDGTIGVSTIGSSSVKLLRGHKKPIYSIDLSEKHKLIASGGREKDIFIWNPFLDKRLVTLRGHNSPILRVAFNENFNQLISIGIDKTIKIWDIRTYKAIQTLEDDTLLPYEKKTISTQKQQRRKENYSAAFYDTHNRTIVTASRVLNLWPLASKNKTFKDEYNGHRTPVIKVLCNHWLGHVVTIDENIFATWELETGRLIIKFSIPSVVIDATFDGAQRRVITVCGDGHIYLYNYLNGTMVKECKTPESEEMNTTTYIFREDQDLLMIAAGGSNRRVLLWDDLEDDHSVSCVRTMSRLPSDVSKLCFMDPNTLLAGLDDGSIFALEFITGDIRMKVRPKRGLKYSEYDEILTSNARDSRNSRHSLRKDFTTGLQIEDMILVYEFILITARGNGLITFWDARELRELYTFQGTIDGDPVLCLSLISDSFLVTGDKNGYLTIYDISKVKTSMNHISKHSITIFRRLRAHTKLVSGLSSLSSQDSIVILSCSADCTVMAHDLEGTFIGFFGQAQSWNIHDKNSFGIEDIDTVRPRIDRLSEEESGERENESRENSVDARIRSIEPSFLSLINRDNDSSSNQIKLQSPSSPCVETPSQSTEKSLGMKNTPSKFPSIKKEIFSQESRLAKVYDTESELIKHIGESLVSHQSDIDRILGRGDEEFNESKTNTLVRIRKNVQDKSSVHLKRTQHFQRNVLQKKISEKDWIMRLHHLIELPEDLNVHKHFRNVDGFDIDRIIAEDRANQSNDNETKGKQKKRRSKSVNTYSSSRLLL